MKVLVSREYLTNIANSIRAKLSSSARYKPGEMSDAIDNIETIYAPRYVSFREYKGTDLIPELRALDTSNMTNMSTMFYYCNGLTSINVSNFNTTRVTSMRYMFYSCNRLINLDLSSFNTANVTDMSFMFQNCERLQFLDLRNFTFNNVSSYTSMLIGIPNDCLIIVKDDAAKNWITSKFYQLTNVKTVAEYEAS